MSAMRWAKQKFVNRRPVAYDAGLIDMEPVVLVPSHPVEHTKRIVLFENNIPQFFDVIKDDPAYADAPTLIDQTMIVNGKDILPGTSTEITIEDGTFVVTIRLYKGFAKLIYAMQKGALRGILMELLKHMEPWLKWQYNVKFAVKDDVDFIQLSDLVLIAYNKSLDQNAVNHRFKSFLLVDLWLNEIIDL
jgi:hypothetical protein